MSFRAATTAGVEPRGWYSMSTATANEDQSAWQALELEQDLLLDILGRLSITDRVKFCSVSHSWTRAIESCCNPFDTTTVTAATANKPSFIRWVERRKTTIKQLAVTPSVASSSPGQRPYLSGMTALQQYRDFGNVQCSTLGDLQPTVHQLNANLFLLPCSWEGQRCIDPNTGLNLVHLTALRSLGLHAVSSAGDRAPIVVSVKLPETNNLEQLSLTLDPAVVTAFQWSGGWHALQRLKLSSICSQAEIDTIVHCINLVELDVGMDADSQARPLLDVPAYDYKLDVSGVGELQKLETLDLTLKSCYLLNAHHLQSLPALQELSVSMAGDVFGLQVAVLFRPQSSPAASVQFELEKLKHVKLQMHSVFDVTDCLEGLHLVGFLRSLHVVLTQSSSRSPSEAHWAIKSGSVLARAASLQHLKIECTSMLIRCLPPQLKTLDISAKKINIESHLRLPLSQLCTCLEPAHLRQHCSLCCPRSL